jgi:hypothetical protein
MTELNHDSDKMPVRDLVRRYRDGLLNLNPGFQRDSVWGITDRRLLIDTIVRNYPLPAIFLYRRLEGGRAVYDVIDGKQRIESILMFMGEMKGQRFEAELQVEPESEPERWSWKDLCKYEKQHLIEDYRLLAVEVKGDLSDIISLFVRINSTGKPLTPAEKRHARYYNSELLKTAGKLASSYEDYLLDEGILSESQIKRMKHVELMSELLVSIHTGDVLNKKATLDPVMKANGVTSLQLAKARQKTITAMNRVSKMFPNLYTTRFKGLADFYSLVFLIYKFEEEGLVLIDKKRNQMAQALLTEFGNGVDKVRELQRKFKPIPASLAVQRDYLSTVMQATDEINQRRKRHEILKSLLGGLFERKDIKRGFTPEQRRLIWNTADVRRCEVCKKPLTWSDFTIDHIKPHSKGGLSELSNAALLCRQHNSAKGNK